jgi:hypothetical protein
MNETLVSPVDNICELCKQNANSYLNTSLSGLKLCVICYQREQAPTKRPQKRSLSATENTQYSHNKKKKRKISKESTISIEDQEINTIKTNIPSLENENVTGIQDNTPEANAEPVAKSKTTHVDKTNQYTCYTCSESTMKLYQLRPCYHLMCIKCAFQGLEARCPICGRKADQCIEKHTP